MEITTSNNGMSMGRIGGTLVHGKVEYIIGGDYKTSYCPEDRTYIITRTDGKCFDGNEDLGTIFSNNNRNIPKTLDEIVEHIINSAINLFKMNYGDDENFSSMFLEFDYEINKENTQIKVYPFYLDLEDFTSYTIKIDTKLDAELGPLCLCFDPIRKCRKLNEYEKMCIDTLALVCNKFGISNGYHAGFYKEDCICISKNDNIWQVYKAVNSEGYCITDFKDCRDACVDTIARITETSQQAKEVADYFLHTLELNTLKKIESGKITTDSPENPKMRKKIPNNKKES